MKGNTRHLAQRLREALSGLAGAPTEAAGGTDDTETELVGFGGGSLPLSLSVVVGPVAVEGRVAARHHRGLRHGEKRLHLSGHLARVARLVQAVACQRAEGVSARVDVYIVACTTDAADPLSVCVRAVDERVLEATGCSLQVQCWDSTGLRWAGVVGESMALRLVVGGWSGCLRL